MVIMHNLTAMNANRMYNINTKKRASITEKLSSGYKINRAADDAAGLSMSEKMRRQIRGLTQASLNAQDGISMIQLADGAMSEIHEMLQRGNELCVKSATGTLTEEDRKYIQEEIEHLEKEIDALSERTDFNEIKVLKGRKEPTIIAGINDTIIAGGFPSWAKITGNDSGYMSGEHTTTETFEASDGTQTQHQITHESTTIDFSSYDGSDAKKKELMKGGFYTTCCTCTNHYSIKFSDASGNSREISGDNFIYTIGLDGINNSDDLIKAIISGTENGNPNRHFTNFVQDGNKLIIYDDRSNASSPMAGQAGKWIDWKYSSFNINSGNGRGTFGTGVAYSATDFDKFRDPVNLYIQIGAEARQHLDIELPEISALALGIDTVDASTVGGAEAGIDMFKKAIEYVNTERSRMGAYQNRLEHTIANLDNVVENTTAAESQIRDTDMAEAMVKFSNINILMQAGEAMLAQANQSKQGILSLLG